MNRLGFCILVFLTTILVQVNSSDNVMHSTNTLYSVSGFALETILSKHESLEHQLREDVQEQRKSSVKNQEKLIQTLELLLKMQQEMQQKHTESQQAIAHIQHKQNQSFDILSKVQGEMEMQRKETMKDREEFAKWKTETGATIAAIEIESANRQKDVLDGIATNRGEQEQSLKLLNITMVEVKKLKKDETNYRSELSNCHTQSQQSIAEIRRKQEQNVKSLDSITQKLAELKSTLSAQEVEAKKNQNEIGNRIELLKSDHKQMRDTLLDFQLGSYRSCKDVPLKVTGKYKIRVNEKSKPFEAYCVSDGGGWMVIQWRYDGKQNFNRNWADYRNGFGDVVGEHWLGLERIHQYTKEHSCELLIQLKDFSGTFKYAMYDSFAIGSEAEGYNLKTLGAYRGTAGDPLSHHKGMKFSTPDRDNDNHADIGCAQEWGGGWWFKACYEAYLNGLYQNVMGPGRRNIAWHNFNKDWRGLSNTVMMIRPLN